MSRLSHFGATDISAPLGSGIAMSRVESCCTRLCWNSEAGSVLQITFVRAGSARNLAGVFRKTALFSAGAENFKSLASTSSATSALLISIAFLPFARKCFAANPSTNSSGARRSTLATSSAPTIEGDNPPWRPVNAYDDGRKVYIEFSPGIGQGEMPPLFVIGFRHSKARCFKPFLVIIRASHRGQRGLFAGDSSESVFRMIMAPPTVHSDELRWLQ